MLAGVFYVGANMNSRHGDCFQLTWKAGSKTATLNLSKQQVRDYLYRDIVLHNLVTDFVEDGMDVYELLREGSPTQTEER